MNDSVLDRQRKIEKLENELLLIKQNFRLLKRNDKNYKQVRDSINNMYNKIENLRQRNKLLISFIGDF